jgi:hypothetical protein
MHSSPMLRKARGILGHANIDVTQNVYGWLAITVASFGFQFWQFQQSLFSPPHIARFARRQAQTARACRSCRGVVACGMARSTSHPSGRSTHTLVTTKSRQGPGHQLRAEVAERPFRDEILRFRARLGAMT